MVPGWETEIPADHVVPGWGAGRGVVVWKVNRKKTKRGRKTRKYKWKTNSQMVNTNSAMSTITLNIKGLNHPIKRKRLTGWIMKQNPTICSLKAF